MKKRLLLLLCGVMCLFLMLCSCGDEEENPNNGSSSSSQNTQSSIPLNNGSPSSSSVIPDNGGDTQNSGNDGENGGEDNKDNGEISAPETPCELSSLGHYWSDVVINKNTSATGSVSISGKCDLCKDKLYKVCTSLVDYNEWKSALSEEGLSSFTEVIGKEYTDYDKNGSISWRVDEEGTYTADYFINSDDKNSASYSDRFKGFLLQYNDFKYDSISKTYVYWINEKSYIELGFADGKLISHSTCTQNGDREEKSTTLYLNHQRIKIESPDFIEKKFTNALSLEILKKSTIGTTLAEGIYRELSKIDFSGSYEASMLKNDEVSIYFYLDSAGKNPVSGEDYFTSSVVVIDGKITKVVFGSTTLEIEYK